MTSPATFHQFPLLPHELQSHIWSLACVPLPYSKTSYGGVNQSFLGDISCSHIYHPNNSDHHLPTSRCPPQRLPSLYECAFGALQYLDGYDDTWNLLGACVESRMAFLKMLKGEVDSVPSMSEQENRSRYWGPGLSLEEVREGLVSEIEEVIGWLKVRKGSGVFKDPALDVRELHNMHILARQIILQQVSRLLSHPEYEWSENAINISASFLRTISDGKIHHYQPIDVCPSFPRRISQSLPSLYCCMYGELQYVDGYRDTSNLQGACVESRRSVLKMLRRVMCEIELPERGLNEESWFSFEPTTLEEVKGCVVREIMEVIGWLDEEKRGVGFLKK